MNTKIYIGLIDSGCNDIKCDGKLLSIKNDKFELKALKEDTLEHGTAMSNIITNKFADFYCMQVFDKALITTAEHIAFSIDYLCEKNVDLIHMSLGLKNDRNILKQAIQRALKQNITIVSSSASISKFDIYPASYEGVISVTADARCKNEQISYLNLKHAKFGASPLSQNPKIRGSSSAAAHFTKAISKLHFQGIINLKAQLEIIKEKAAFKTPQNEFLRKIQ